MSAKKNTQKLMSDIVDLAKVSFEQEERREQSILSQSGKLLTALSISSAAILMIVPIFIQNLALQMKNYILICLIIVLFLVLTSMFFSLLVQWRFKYNSLPSPEEIFTHIANNEEYFETSEQRCRFWIDALENNWRSKLKNNNKKVIFLKIAMILFFVSLGSIAILFIIGIVLCSYIK